MVEIRAGLSPIRMVLSERKPVELSVELLNNTNKTAMVSLDIVLNDYIAFDKGGRSNFQTKNLNQWLPEKDLWHTLTYFQKRV